MSYVYGEMDYNVQPLNLMPLTAFKAWSPVACDSPHPPSLAVLWYLSIHLPNYTGDTCMPKAVDICPLSCKHRCACVLHPSFLLAWHIKMIK